MSRPKTLSGYLGTRSVLLALALSFLVPKAEALQPDSGSSAAGAIRSLFEGASLDGWKKSDFSGGGDVRLSDGVIFIDTGEELSGLQWERGFPTLHYEVEVLARRVAGMDFFATLTFPCGGDFLSLVVGGWGGTVVGLSSINQKDASSNETTEHRHFVDHRWYQIRLRVEVGRIRAWIDGEAVVDLHTAGKQLGLRSGEIEIQKPFGISTFRSSSEVKSVKLRILQN